MVSSGSKENEQEGRCPSRMELIEVMCKREIGCVNYKVGDFKDKGNCLMESTFPGAVDVFCSVHAQ